MNAPSQYRLRAITQNDAALLLSWRNRREVRRASFEDDLIPPATHKAWIRDALARTDAIYRIFEDAGRPLGHVHAVHDGGGTWRWSFYIGAADAARGSGTRMLILMLDDLFEGIYAQRVIGATRSDNEPSIRTHLRLGFDRSDRNMSGRETFTLDAAQWRRRRAALHARYFGKQSPPNHPKVD